MKPPTILIAGDRGRLRERIYKYFVAAEIDPIMVEEGRHLRSLLQRHHPLLALCVSSNRSTTNSLKMLTKIRGIDRSLPVVLVAARGSESLAVAALRAGARDYFGSPFTESELQTRCQELMHGRRFREAGTARAENRSSSGYHSMVGGSDTMHAIKSYIEKVARAESTVLITGETGTGKELAARWIHARSPRRAKPWIRINCSALPEGLVESELFGHDRGAFTGAVGARPGKFELADGGSLFLDEIGEMDFGAQAKILHCIENKTVFPLGAREALPLDIRIIAATNQDPEALIAEGRFREDLYYRVSVARLHVPPLRERREDIPDLIAHGIRKLNRKFNSNVQGLQEDVLALLLRYNWPGNVRELMNVLEGAFINMPTKKIKKADLPPYFKQKLAESQHLPANERKRILAALLETNWNKSTAAARLKWSRMTLYRKMTKYHIVENRRPPR